MFSIADLNLPVITSDDEESVMLGIVLNNIPINYKGNVTLTLTNEELK